MTILAALLLGAGAFLVGGVIVTSALGRDRPLPDDPLARTERDPSAPALSEPPVAIRPALRLRIAPREKHEGRAAARSARSGEWNEKKRVGPPGP